jgi:uncharacterized protein
VIGIRYGAEMEFQFGYEFLLFVLIGLFAQIIDGALGMAYGLLTSSILLSLGFPPVIVSASVHTAEIATTGVSGASHLYHGNVDKKLLFKLAIPGMIGGAAGAYFLSSVAGDTIKPFVLAYLLLLGCYLLYKATGHALVVKEPKRVPVIGFIAGLLDAIGGGGWGPISTSTLLAQGGDVRKSIGSVNAAEFLVTMVISISFFFTVGVHHWNIVLGLLIGGVIAAPVAAMLVKKLPAKGLMYAVAGVVLSISTFQLYNFYF